MSKYINHNIKHSSSLTELTTNLDPSKIGAKLVIKYKIARIMERVALLLIFLSFFAAIAAYFFKDGEEITLLAGFLFFGGFIGAITFILLLVYYINLRQCLQPFAYLIYQIKANDIVSVNELIVHCNYDLNTLVVSIDRLLATNNLNGYQLINNKIITNNRYQQPHQQPTKQKKSTHDDSFPNLDVLNKNIYRFKRINIFLANHFLIILVVSLFIFLGLFIANIIRTDTSDAIVAMKVIFIPFFGYFMFFTFAYNIFVVNATNKINYYELIETIKQNDQIRIDDLEINGVTNIPLLTYIVKQLIKTKSIKGYYLEKNVIRKIKR